MRPIHVVVLLLAGALAGALIVRVVHPDGRTIRALAKGQPPATAPPEQPAAEMPAPAVQAPDVQTAEVQATEVQATEVQAADVQTPAETQPAKPSPMPTPERRVARREVPKPQPLPMLKAAVTAAVPPEPVALLPAPPPVEDPAPVPTPLPVIVAVSAAPPPQPHQVTLNAGMLLPVRLVDGLSSERNAAGDAFAATLDRELVAGGFVIAERGARVEGRVVAVDRLKAGGSGALAMELTRLHTSDGQSVAIRTENYFKHADAARVLTRGKSADLASESLVTFKLKSPVPLTEKLQ